MLNKVVFACFACAFVAGISPVASASIILPQVSTFDRGLDGWILNNESLGALGWVSTGGDTGGYARFKDAKSGRGYILAPEDYLGDWSSLNGVAVLSFEHKVLSRGVSAHNLPFRVMLTGPGGAASFTDSVAPTTTWQMIAVPIQPSAWHVTGGTWASLLADVTELKISIEAIDNERTGSGSLDRDGIDNVRLTGSFTPPPPGAPEPATLSLLAFGALALLGRRRRSTRPC